MLIVSPISYAAKGFQIRNFHLLKKKNSISTQDKGTGNKFKTSKKRNQTKQTKCPPKPKMHHCHREVTPEGVPTTAEVPLREALGGSCSEQAAATGSTHHRPPRAAALSWTRPSGSGTAGGPHLGCGSLSQTRIWRRDFSRQEDQAEGCRRAQVCHPQHGPQKPPASHTRGCGCTLAGAPPWGVTPRAWALRPRLCLGWHRTRPWERASRPVLSRFLSKPRGPSCRVLCCPLLGLTLTAQGEASCWGRGRPPSQSSPSGCTGPPDFRKAKSQTSCS